MFIKHGDGKIIDIVKTNSVEEKEAEEKLAKLRKNKSLPKPDLIPEE
jgi:hypothetical protein